MSFFTKYSLHITLSVSVVLSSLAMVSYASTSTKVIQAKPVMQAKASTLAPYQQRNFQDEVFYFVLPDRFYNGDSSNDLGADANDIKRALSRGGFDKTDKGMYHGGDLAGLTQKLPYLDNMGITAIWLTPVLRNQAVQNDSSGYHGYWILDFSEIDPHLGSNADLKNLIEQAHQRNIKVFFDIITNHTADVIKYKECHSSDGLTWLAAEKKCTFKSLAQVAQGDSYTPFIPKSAHLSKGEIPLTQVKTPAWLNDIDVYHNQGDSHWAGESAMRGDFSGLDDIDTNSDKVVTGMINIYKKIIDEFKPDGFRIDTVKHVNMEFWQEFSPALMQHAKKQGIENFFMFGEVYSFTPEELSRYTVAGKLPSVLDFALQSTLRQTLIEQQGTDVLAKLFAQDPLYQTDHQSTGHQGTAGQGISHKLKNTNANQLVNFTGNHDMGRFAYFLKTSKHNYNQQELIQRYLLAHAMVYFNRGVPVIYYGDEQGFVGDGGDQASRQDMMPSKVSSYNDDDLLATNRSTADDNFDTKHLFYQSFAKYASLYQQYPALRYGQQEVVYSQDSAGLFAFTRQYNGHVSSQDAEQASVQGKQQLLIVFNTDNKEQGANISLKHEQLANNKKYQLLYQSAPSQLKQDIKQLELLLAPLSFAIYQMHD